MFKLLFACLATLCSTGAFAHGMTAADKARILDAGYIEYIQLGAKHMLTGYDHLLFLFGVMFFLTNFRDILKFITAFTIGHSITLIFATLLGIQANYFLIDAVIALTVCYKAFDNLGGFENYLKMRAPNLTWMVFAFGLIHGFGLSTRLQQLPLGEDGLVLRILSFNVGVELGQIIALGIMLLVLSGWRKSQSFARFSTLSNWLLMAAGLLLLVMQLHGYIHTRYSEEFPLNKDDHSHTHEDMRGESTPLLNYPKRLQIQPQLNTEPLEPAEDTQLHSHDGSNFHSH